jgi:hypothetical protein
MKGRFYIFRVIAPGLNTFLISLKSRNHKIGKNEYSKRKIGQT